MSLDTSRLRTPDKSFPAFRSSAVNVVRIRGQIVTQANDASSKRDLLRDLQPDDTLIALWTGRYSTDAFKVTPKLIASWQAEYGGL